MAGRIQRTANKALRSTVAFGANRVASSERLMSVVYDNMNETNFAGLADHEEMLSDAVRVDAYHRGIHRNVAPGDVVLDLGTGTGLLAFMASRAGAAKVYAVEHSDFIEVAREIGRHNGFTNVEFVQANSREFTPPEPIDVVLHEQMGDELFNENMLENLLDLRDRVLAPGRPDPPGAVPAVRRAGHVPTRRCASVASTTSSCPTASTCSAMEHSPALAPLRHRPLRAVLGPSRLRSPRPSARRSPSSSSTSRTLEIARPRCRATTRSSARRPPTRSSTACASGSRRSSTTRRR